MPEVAVDQQSVLDAAIFPIASSQIDAVEFDVLQSRLDKVACKRLARLQSAAQPLSTNVFAADGIQQPGGDRPHLILFV
jgi:hypothetical protein